MITCCDANFLRHHQMRSKTSLQCQCFCLLSHDINYCIWFASHLLINSSWQCRLTRNLQTHFLTSGYFYLGNCFSGTTQSRVTMGAERWKRKIHFCASWWSFRERNNLGHAWTDHRESRLEVRLLHPRIDDVCVRSLLVSSCHWFSSRSLENLKKWTRIHSRFPRWYCDKGQKLPTDSFRHFFGSILCFDNSSLRIIVGTLLPSNCRANVHDWSFELQLIKSRHAFVTATSCQTYRWFWIRCHRWLYSQTKLHESHNDAEIFLFILWVFFLKF